MRKQIILGALLATAACTHLPHGANRPAPLSDRWLIGAWAADGESCASDAGVIYQADRTWLAQGTRGTWRIEGATLTFFVTEQWEDGEPPVRLAQPERHIRQIEAAEADRFVSRGEDGTIFRMGRCPE